MGCGCGGKKTAQQWKVTLPSGETQTKTSEADAKILAAKNPGSTVTKV